MIRRTCILAFLLGLGFWATSGPGLARLEDNLLPLSDENLAGYLDPLNTALSGTLSSAVFRTGHVPDAGLDFSFGVAVMAIGFSEEDRTFTFQDPPYFTSAEPTQVPTVVGSPDGGSVMGSSGLKMLTLGGFDLGGFEIAVPQVSLGSVLGTRAVVRYIALDLGDSEIGSFKYLGLGGQHSITRWVPSLPVDVAAGVFYQSFELGDVIEAKMMQFNVTGSRQFGFLQPYAGIGYDKITLHVTAQGEDDPEPVIDLSLDPKSNLHMTAGLLARLKFVGLYGEFNAGAGTGFALGLDLGTIGGAGYATRDAN